VPTNVIDVKPVAPLNALSSILVTLDGMVIDAKLVAPWNVPQPILVTLDEMIIDKPVAP
jgi:hypothetical protein